MVGLAFAQPRTMTCRGIVIDELGEPVVGATVQAKGTSTGVPTDIDGKFSIKVPSNTKELQISYVGYKTLTLKAEPEMGEIKITPDSKMLQDVVVTSSIAKTRETPIAISEITAAEIETKLGNKEFPEVLKGTPGVWATPDGGGYGDAKINMRGFKAPNVAVLINGIPMNDMEWGGIYWSNFAGLSNVTSNMQTQRGLGAAIISTPSIGGTIAITTRGLDSHKGGTFWYGTGNDGLNDIGINLSTGLMKNGWAITVLGSHKWANGYIQGTQYSAWNYFVNVSKKIGDKNQISLTAFGAPQWHNQRNSGNGLTVMGWQQVKQYMNGESPYRYNPTYGFDNEGQQRTANKNFYHKPIISLNHIWQINEYSSLSSALYVSLSKGGGYAGQGRTSDWRYAWYGATNGVLNWDTNTGMRIRRPDGTFDYGAIQDMNAASTTGSNMVMSSSNNDHEWYGLVSTYKNEILPNRLTITAGIDLRYYVGHHNNKIIDLYSGDYYIDDSSRGDVKVANNYRAADPAWVNQKLGVGDIVYRNYNGYVNQEGIYGQAEGKYLDGKITTIIAGSLNATTQQRKDMFYYDEAHAWSEKRTSIGGTIKGGLNWNIDRYNNVFVNGGFISKAPFFSYGVFLSSATSNDINPNMKNEKIGSVEAGYSFHSPKFTMTLNGYFTRWLDKTDAETVRTGTVSDQNAPNYGERFSLNLENVEAQHWGVEFNCTYLPLTWLELNGMFSWGDWIWNNNPIGYYYSSQGQPLADPNKGTIASGIKAADHAWAKVEQKGVHIGGSAQTTAAVGAQFRPFKGFRIGCDWTINARTYSDYAVSGSSLTSGATLKVKEPWNIPWGNEFDLNASYRFKVAGLDATIYGNVYNLFNYNFVKDATTNYSTKGTWENAYKVFYSFGRTFSVRLKINF
ncbi:MAG: carboxypeptidase-like regulatory domain-containing protein [Muribaculaceae bacterium]|nr:carboxypeptidase-like regulatory domain-containing protein [Muribaculaceae bacterium]